MLLNMLLLLQPLCVNINSKNDMKKCLESELAQFPLSLFTENGFKKKVESQLFDIFTEVLTITENVMHVINGGFLLHKVVWQKRW